LCLEADSKELLSFQNSLDFVCLHCAPSKIQSGIRPGALRLAQLSIL